MDPQQVSLFCKYTMTEKKFKGAPFGTQTSRSDETGIHPSHKRLGPQIECEVERNRGPGTYDPETGDFSAHALQKRAKGPGWKREQETGRLAQRPRVQSRQIWENRLVIQTMLGPSRFDSIILNDDIIRKVSRKHGFNGNKTMCFEDIKSYTQGPGLSEKGLISKSALEKSENIQIGTAPVDTDTDLQRSSFLNYNNVPGPDIYKLPTFVDELKKKPGSKKGICATGAKRFVESKRRTKTSPKVEEELLATLNVTKMRSKTPVIEETVVTTSKDDGKLNNEKLKKKQVGFGTEERFPAVHTERIYLTTLAQCSRPVNFPGPASYDLTSVITKSKTKGEPKSAPFLSSTPRTKTSENINKISHGQFSIKNTNFLNDDHRPLVISKILNLLQSPQKEKLQREQLVVIGVKLGRARTKKQADGVTAQIAPSHKTAVSMNVSGQDR